MTCSLHFPYENYVHFLLAHPPCPPSLGDASASRRALGSKEANRMTIFSQNSPFNSFFWADFCPCWLFFYWAMWANPASLGYNQSQRSWGKGLVAFIDDMLKSFSYRTISCLSKTCVSYPRLVMNWPWAWLVLVKLPEIAVIRQGSNLIQFRFRRIAPLPPYYSQIIPTLNLDNQLGVSKWWLPQITS